MKKHIVPTVRQKIKLYKLVKELISTRKRGENCACICDALYTAQMRFKYLRQNQYGALVPKWSRNKASYTGNDMENNFPELLKRKPENADVNWFWWDYGTEEGIKIRLDVVADILVELEEEMILTTKPKKLK